MKSFNSQLARPDLRTPERAEAISPLGSRHQAREVLLVEDSADYAFLLETVWSRQAGAPELVRVSNGQEAKDYLASRPRKNPGRMYQPPRLILSDLHMPICGGLELLKWLRQQPSLSALPFVIFSSSHEEDDIKGAYAAGADNYIVKPSSLIQYAEILSYLRCFWNAPVIPASPLAAVAS